MSETVSEVKVSTTPLDTYNFGYNTWDTANTSTFSYTYYNTIYKYQVKCPKTSCKTFNWLELDKITPCVKCGAKLKAVSEQEDYTIPVNP